jgi:hypothetical protein
VEICLAVKKEKSGKSTTIKEKRKEEQTVTRRNNLFQYAYSTLNQSNSVTLIFKLAAMRPFLFP